MPETKTTRRTRRCVSEGERRATPYTSRRRRRLDCSKCTALAARSRCFSPLIRFSTRRSESRRHLDLCSLLRLLDALGLGAAPMIGHVARRFDRRRVRGALSESVASSCWSTPVGIWLDETPIRDISARSRPFADPFSTKAFPAAMIRPMT